MHSLKPLPLEDVDPVELEGWVMEILRQPYNRCYHQDQSTGRVHAFMLEFNGCFADGSDFDEADYALSVAAHTWVETVLLAGLAIPVPLTRDFVWKQVRRHE